VRCIHTRRPLTRSERFDDQRQLAGGAGIRLGDGGLASASDRSSRASRGWPAAARDGGPPDLRVTITRSPTTIGDDVPAPASGAPRQVLSRAPRRRQRRLGEIAALPGPRHCGQSCSRCAGDSGDQAGPPQAGPHAAHGPESRDMRAVYGTPSAHAFRPAGWFRDRSGNCWRGRSRPMATMSSCWRAGQRAVRRTTRRRLGRRDAGPWAAELDGADVVINLAGRSVNCRYTPANRAAMIDSRSPLDARRRRGHRAGGAAAGLWIQASTATIYAHTFAGRRDEHGTIGGAEPACRTRGGSASKWRPHWARAL
jgi:hypothetical protein